MHSKEECEKALEHLIECKQRKLCDKCKFKLRCTMSNDELVINQLIEEHFKPKENTSEFKHFKLHSDNTLKNLTKKELIDYINMLYHNWGVCDEQLAHSLNAYNNLEEKHKSIDFTLDKQFEHIEEIEKILDVCGIVAIKKRVKELTNIEPYKFEDLKEDMWVYDIKVKWLFKIVSVDIGIEALKHYVFIVENRDGSTSLINFEENRFFPVQCANWNGSER